jgi:alpha-glucoside transport system permease protein
MTESAPPTGRRHAGRISGRLLLHLALLLAVAGWSVPTIALFVSSFRDPVDIAASGWWQFVSELGDLTTGNYEEVLDRQGVGEAFVNSLLITVPSTMLIILVAAFAAYAFAQMEFPGRRTLFLVVVALLVVPLQITLIPILRLYTELRVDVDIPVLGGRLFGTGSFVGIWLAHTAYGLPFAIFLLRNFFAALPKEIFESAYLDGASDSRVFFRIVLPLSMPAVAALAIFQFLWVWNDLLVALVLLNDPDLAPLTVRINNLVSSFGEGYQLLTAAAFISMALPLVVFFALQRYFVQGILAGAVKG